MTNGAGSGIATQRVLILGTDELAAALESSLGADGVDVVPVASAPVALATLDAVDVQCVVVVDDAAGRPDDFFGAARRKGHQVPGVFVSEEARHLPPSVEQAPANPAAAAGIVRQRLLATAAADAEAAVTEDPLAAYGSTVAHELRNHLAAAGMAVESLEGSMKGQATDALERLRDLATEAEAVASGSVGDVEVLQISSVVGAAADRIHVDSFTVECDADGTVKGNRALLVLLFENLFRNGVEHAGTDVTVRVTETEAGFAVVDDGAGFESDRPFEWGYTTGSGQGTGLAVVRRIVQAHGWSVTAGNDDGARIDVVTG